MHREREEEEEEEEEGEEEEEEGEVGDGFWWFLNLWSGEGKDGGQKRSQNDVNDGRDREVKRRKIKMYKKGIK